MSYASISRSSQANPWLDPAAPKSPTDPFLIAADLFDPPALADVGDDEVPRASWQLEPHQKPPPGTPGLAWFLWLLLGGRGAGKTQACAAYMHAHAIGPPCLPGPMPHRMAIVAPTLGDASESCVNGPSGLRAHNPAVVEITRKGGSFVNWPNGSQARLFGAYTAQEPERLRAGGNRCCVWMEEVAAWRYLADCWKHIRLGLLRLGPTPHVIASTTPRNRPTMKTLIALAQSTGSLTHGTTDQNPHLPVHIRAALYKDYGGTRLGRQELEGQMIEDVVGALWSEEQLEQCRIAPADAPSERPRLVIAVDPSWGTTNDEVGIVAGFRGPDDRAYIVEDLSGVMTPSEWGARVAKAYERLEADHVIAEANFQAEQVRLVMKTAHVETGIRVNFKLVSASRGKVLRAEPVVALYEQGRVKHIGRHVGLEHQMCVARGSLVMTRRGIVPVEQVHAGDEAWTRAGWRAVDWAGQTGRRRVIEIDADGRRLRCTPDHRVWIVDRGWVRADDVQTGDIMIGCRASPSARSSTSRAVATTRTPTSTSRHRARDAARKLGCCIATSMRQLTGRSLTAGRSTTSITIERTTPPRISKHSRSGTTPSTILVVAHPNTRLSSAPRNSARCGPSARRAMLSAPSAAASSSRPGCEPCSAPVVVDAVTTSASAVTDVFDLTVAGEHEYFADGLLVHNCHWVPPRNSEGEGEDRGDPEQADPEREPGGDPETSEDPLPSDYSPDRVDALVFLVTDLLLGSGGPATVSYPGREMMPRRRIGGAGRW